MNPEKGQRARAIAELAGSAVVLLALPFGVFYWANPLFTDKYPAIRTLGNDYAYFSIQEQYELQFSLWHGTVPLYVPGYYGGQSASALTLGQFFHPLSHLASLMPQYWDTADPEGLNGHALQINTLLRLLSLGITQLVLYRLIRSWGLDVVLSFVISWVTVYNMRMLTCSCTAHRWRTTPASSWSPQPYCGHAITPRAARARSRLWSARTCWSVAGTRK